MKREVRALAGLTHTLADRDFDWRCFRVDYESVSAPGFKIPRGLPASYLHPNSQTRTPNPDV